MKHSVARLAKYRHRQKPVRRNVDNVGGEFLSNTTGRLGGEHHGKTGRVGGLATLGGFPIRPDKTRDGRGFTQIEHGGQKLDRLPIHAQQLERTPITARPAPCEQIPRPLFEQKLRRFDLAHGQAIGAIAIRKPQDAVVHNGLAHNVESAATRWRSTPKREIDFDPIARLPTKESGEPPCKAAIGGDGRVYARDEGKCCEHIVFFRITHERRLDCIPWQQTHAAAFSLHRIDRNARSRERLDISTHRTRRYLEHTGKIAHRACFPRHHRVDDFEETLLFHGLAPFPSAFEISTA